MKQSQGKAHAKLIVLGEHSVVYGFPALALPLPELDVRCQLTTLAHVEDSKTDLPWVYFESEFGQGDLDQFQDHSFYVAICIGLCVVAYAKHQVEQEPFLLNAGKHVECALNKASESVKNKPLDPSAALWEKLNFQNLDYNHLKNLHLKTLAQTHPSLQKLLEQMHFHFHIQSNIPHERGLGSSAATTLALLRSLFNHFPDFPFCQYALQEKQLEQLAFLAERIAHHQPSGIDISVCSQNQALIFQKQPDGTRHLQTYALDLPAYLFVLDSGIQGKTKQAVQQVKQHPQAQRLLEQLGTLTQNTLKALQNPSLSASQKLHHLGEALTRSHLLLKTLGVSHPSIDQALESIAHLSLGGKMSGGGLGGVYFALFDNITQLEEAKKILHSRFPNSWCIDLQQNIG